MSASQPKFMGANKPKTPNLPQFKAKAFKGVINKLPRKSGRKK